MLPLPASAAHPVHLQADLNGDGHLEVVLATPDLKIQVRLMDPRVSLSLPLSLPLPLPLPLSLLLSLSTHACTCATPYGPWWLIGSTTHGLQPPYVFSI